MRFFTLIIFVTTFLFPMEQTKARDKVDTTLKHDKMKIEIWSDIMCPFCYIGKRHLEAALEVFPGRENIEIVWKSFQLNPNLPEKADSSQSSYEYIAQSKGISLEQSISMHEGAVNMAINAGLNFDFDKALITNSMKAHRVLQIAKSRGLGNKMKETLLNAYFVEGKDLSNNQVLISLGKEVGLTEEAINESLTNSQYLNQVNRDIQESQQLNVQGVPFFVFDRKYGISGAQPVGNFVQTIEKSYGEWREKNETTGLKVTEGPSCTLDKNCE
jgi:protein disulfide-isomerase